MADLNDLLNQGLSGIISSGGLPTADALYQQQAQADRENTFGRGLGISTVTRDALAKARVDATLAAQNAQLAALGQAAGIQQGAANRAQQESQFSRQLGQQKSLANQQMLASGLGAGVGALGGLAGASFGPEIRSGARGLFGLKPLSTDARLSGGGGATTPGGVTPTAAPDMISGAGGPSLPDLGSIPNLTTPDFGGSLNTPDFSSGFDLGGPSTSFDLSGLFDAASPAAFSPGYDWSQIGWG
jgi:hypothetical protein